MAEEVCGLPQWRVLSRMRKFALALCFLLMAAWPAEHAFGPRMASAVHLAENFIFLGLIVTVIFAIRQADEFIRRMHLVAATAAFIAQALFLNVFAVLQQTGTFHASLGTVEATLYIPWAFAMIYLSWRYR